MWEPIKKLLARLKELYQRFLFFNIVRHQDSDDFSTQQQFISFPFWNWLDLFRNNEDPVSHLRAILFAYFCHARSLIIPDINFLLSCMYHRVHIFRSTIARRGTPSYLIFRVISSNLFISSDLRIYLSIF